MTKEPNEANEALFQSIDKAIAAAQEEINPLPCYRVIKGKTCLQAFDGQFDKEGRPLFWYGVDCDVPRKAFCHPCLAYWLISVARNEIIALRRTGGF
jgi:hypothetical protein